MKKTGKVCRKKSVSFLPDITIEQSRQSQGFREKPAVPLNNYLEIPKFSKNAKRKRKKNVPRISWDKKSGPNSPLHMSSSLKIDFWLGQNNKKIKMRRQFYI